MSIAAAASSDCLADAEGLLHPEQALARMLSDVGVIAERENVPACDAIGRIASDDVVSPVALPRFDNSAVDGFGIHEADLCGAGSRILRLQGRSFAGHPAHAALAPGNCCRILTGAIVPPDVSAIVMEEHVVNRGPIVAIERLPTSGANIRRKGEDVAAGATIVRKGTLLDARHAAILAAAEVSRLSALRPLRVAVVSTGDELGEPDANALAGKIPDTNRPLLLALMTGKTLDVVDLGIVRDDRDSLTGIFADAAESFDLLVSTGGVSGSEADHVSPAIRSAGGRCDHMRLALRPGKPISWGSLGGMKIVALPGNPVAAFVGFTIFVRPVIDRMLGRPSLRLSSNARTAHVFEHRAGRAEFVPVRSSGASHDGLPLLHKLGRGGSARLLPLVEADGLARMGPDVGDVAAGSPVEFFPFSAILRN